LIICPRFVREIGDVRSGRTGGRGICCPLAGITGLPETADHYVADHANLTGTVKAALPGQRIVIPGSISQRGIGPLTAGLRYA